LVVNGRLLMKTKTPLLSTSKWAFIGCGG